MSKPLSNIGMHCTWDVYGANENKLSFVPYIRDVLHNIVDELQLAKVKEAFKQFEPIGATGFILLEESHISIHTWPEHQYAAVDVFSCKTFDAEKVKQLLISLLQADRIEMHHIERGKLPSSDSSSVA